MWRTALFIVVAGMLILPFPGLAQAQVPRVSAECWAADDSGPNPLCQDGPYAPCCNTLRWTFEFYRNGSAPLGEKLRFQIVGTNVDIWTNYDGDYYQYQTYLLKGNGIVTDHYSNTLKIERYYAQGRFEQIHGTARYYEDKPTGGDE